MRVNKSREFIIFCVLAIDFDSIRFSANWLIFDIQDRSIFSILIAAMKEEVVTIGGGFAGINLVKHLADEKDFHVTLVDMNNYNVFPPLLYQVATGFLEASNICCPFSKLFHGKKHKLPFGRTAKSPS